MNYKQGKGGSSSGSPFFYSSVQRELFIIIYLHVSPLLCRLQRFDETIWGVQLRVQGGSLL